MYDDPDGQCPFCPWLDAVVDVGFVLYDVGVLVHEKVTTGSTSVANWAALGADGASILVPMSVGAGVAVRAGVKAVNKVDNAVDIAKTADKAGDAKKTFQTYTKDPKLLPMGFIQAKQAVQIHRKKTLLIEIKTII